MELLPVPVHHFDVAWEAINDGNIKLALIRSRRGR